MNRSRSAFRRPPVDDNKELSLDDFLRAILQKQTLNTFVEHFYRSYIDASIDFRYLKVYSINVFDGHEGEVKKVLNECKLFVCEDRYAALEEWLLTHDDTCMEFKIAANGKKLYSRNCTKILIGRNRCLYNLLNCYVDKNQVPIIVLLQFIAADSKNVNGYYQMMWGESVSTLTLDESALIPEDKAAKLVKLDKKFIDVLTASRIEGSKRPTNQ